MLVWYTFDTHIRNICSKVNSKTVLIIKNLRAFPYKFRTTLFKLFVVPVFDYSPTKFIHLGKKTRRNKIQACFNISIKKILWRHLEYAVPVWNPYLRKDIDILENVQHKASRLWPGISKRSYEERLKILRLTTLETRRKGGDLIQFYKALSGLDSIEWLNELSMVERGVNVRKYVSKGNR